MSPRPEWLFEGARVLDPGQDWEGIVQFIGDFEDPSTRRGREWIVADHQALRPAEAR
ncbi:hypothetical protein ACFWJT_31945 [Streptomyces sp. NPDC127069]|uniref:hypothetical protein n=1 Tax=Streptomyces sp. NPDC127069 TaxID=3347128 RepID=UPI0036624390